LCRRVIWENYYFHTYFVSAIFHFFLGIIILQFYKQKALALSDLERTDFELEQAVSKEGSYRSSSFLSMFAFLFLNEISNLPSNHLFILMLCFNSGIGQFYGIIQKFGTW